MKNLSLFVIAAVVCSNLVSCDPCTKKTDCPAYDSENFDKWFPYSDGQNIIFMNDSNQTETIAIQTVTKSTPYKLTQKTGWNTKEEFCKSSAEVFAPNKKLHIKDSKGENSHTSDELVFYLKTASVYAKQVSDTGLSVSENDEWQSENVANYNLKGKTYGLMQILTAKDTSVASKGKMNKLYLAKDHGVVGYETYPDKLTWSIQ